ncbi:unnamed protein product [Aphanomyces euteiches]
MTTHFRSYLSKVNHDSPVAIDKTVEGLTALTGSAGINYNRRNSRIVPKVQANRASGHSNSRGGGENGEVRAGGWERSWSKRRSHRKDLLQLPPTWPLRKRVQKFQKPANALATITIPQQAKPAPTQIHGAAAVVSSPNNSSDHGSDDGILTSNIWFVSVEEHIRNSWLLDSGYTAIHKVVPADLAVVVAN